MSQRIVRVNELLKREISMQLHANYRSESTYITITGVDVSPDLRNARVYYSVLGDTEKKKAAKIFFGKKKRDLQKRVSKHVILKYFPNMEFHEDFSLADGATMMELMDEIAVEDGYREEDEGSEEE